MKAAGTSPHLRWRSLDDGRVLEIYVSGKLARRDYDAVLPEIEAHMKDHDKVGFVLVLDHFDGWEPGAAWTDLKFDVTHRDKFDRIAVVGESAMERWGTKLSNTAPFWTLRFFEAAEHDVALDWVRHGEDGR